MRAEQNEPLCIKFELEINMRDKKRNNINWSMTSKHFLYKMDQQQHALKGLLKTMKTHSSIST